MTLLTLNYWCHVNLRLILMVVMLTVLGDGIKYERKSHGIPPEIAPFLIETSQQNSVLQCGIECEEKSCESMQYIEESGNCSIYSVYMKDESPGHTVYAKPDTTERRTVCFTEAVKIFTGALSVTSTNKTCQRWDSQSPHPHPYTQSHMFPDATVADASNYCRDPSGSGYLWCYTTDPDGGGEPCSVYKCRSQGCPMADSRTYTGNLNVTISNRQCQRWDSQSPHNHDYIHPRCFPDNTVSDAQNYCRDPNNETGLLWCYTTTGSGRWDVCDPHRCSDTGCYTIDISLYTGTQNVTASGKTCQRWDTQSPNSHGNTDDSMFPDGSVSDAHNYCRDPDNTGQLWCYTTTGSRWDACKLCADTGCYTIDLSLYTGTVNVTGLGKTCQRWDVQSPTSHRYTDASWFPDATMSDAHNYCRDPDSTGFLWCYPDDGSMWQACDVYRC